MKTKNCSWIVPEGFLSHWDSQLHPMLVPPKGESEESPQLQSIRMVHGILNVIASAPSGRGVSQIAETLETSKARISRQLSTMEKLGLVSRETASRKFKIGPALMHWGIRGLAYSGIDEKLYSAMNHLRQLSGGKAVTFSIMEQNWGRVCMSLSSTGQDPLSVPLGAPLIFPRSPSARILWAFNDRKMALLNSAIAVELVNHTNFDTLEELRENLREVRQSGVAATFDVRKNNRGSVAAPVFDSDNRVVGALALVDFSTNLVENDVEALAVLVQNSAKSISINLMHRLES